MKKLLLLALILISFGMSCDYTGHRCHDTYAFKIPLSCTQKDTFAIGDTIWVSSKIDSLLLDTLSGELIDVTNFDFIYEGNMSLVDSTFIPFAESDFDYVNEIGQVIKYHNAKYEFLRYQYNSAKELKFGIICKKKGTYWLGHDYNPNDNIALDILGEKCLVTQTMTFVMNNYTGNHFDYVKEGMTNYYDYLRDSLDTPMKFTPEEGFYLSGSYGFIVK